MKRILVAVLCVVGVFWGLAAQGQVSLTILNPSFESPVLGDGGQTGMNPWDVPGWTAGTRQWVYNPTDGVFPGTTGSPGTVPGTGSGVNVLIIYGGTGSAEQTLGDTLTTGIYVLKVAVGRWLNQNGSVQLKLYAGTNVLALTSVTWGYSIPNGSFADVWLSYRATSDSPGLGEALKIRITGDDSTSVDNVRLEYYATEPSTTTWYVAPGGADGNTGANWGQAFATIQRGVDAAGLFDTVLVSNNTYTVANRIAVLRDITVRGLSANPSDTIVARDAAAGESRVFYVTAPGAVLSGLTITNGFINGYGAGVYLANGTLTNCVLTGNSVKDQVSNLYGGGVYMENGLITDCVFSNNNERVKDLLNYAPRGGAIAAGAGLIRRCTIGPNNYAANGSGVYAWAGRIEGCRIERNVGGNGAGIYINGPVTVESSVIVSNGTGGIYVNTGPAIIRNCTSSYNTGNSSQPGAGIYAGAQTLIENCVVGYNWNAWYGGGIYAGAGGTIVRGCLVIGNETYDGTGAAGIEAVSGVTVENCTVVGNNARGSGGNTCVGGVYVPSGALLRNTIVRGNRVQVFDGPDVHNLYFNGAAVSNNCAPELTGIGDGNTTNNPLFVAAGSNYGTSYAGYDLRLTNSSPCINAGQDQAWMDDAVDLDGNARLSQTVDMGAYEFQLPPAGTVITIR